MDEQQRAADEALAKEIGEDDQAGRIIYWLSQKEPHERERWLSHIFQTFGKILGGDFTALEARLQRHPKWGLYMNVLGRDEQAERIVDKLNSSSTEEELEGKARSIFEDGKGRLGKRFEDFWERLTRCQNWRGERPAPVQGTPIERLFDLPTIDVRSANVIRNTGCMTIEQLVSEYTEQKLRGKDGCGVNTLRKIREGVATLGFALRKD